MDSGMDGQGNSGEREPLPLPEGEGDELNEQPDVMEIGDVIVDCVEAPDEEVHPNDHPDGHNIQGPSSGSGGSVSNPAWRIPKKISLSVMSRVSSSSDSDEEMDISCFENSAGSSMNLHSVASELADLDTDSSDGDSVYFSSNQNSEGSYYVASQATVSGRGPMIEVRNNAAPVRSLLGPHVLIASPTDEVANAAKIIKEEKEKASAPSKKSTTRPHYLENCEECKKPADFACQGCYRSAYCSEEHQKNMWEAHRPDCIHYGLTRSPSLLYRGPFSVEANEKTEKGRMYGLKSKVSVTEPKQKILEEKPFLVCPWPRIKMRPTERHLAPGLVARNLSCFGCGKALPFSWTRCEDCNLFLCSKQCLYISNHKNSECKIIQSLTPKQSTTLDPRLDLKTLRQHDDYREFLYMDVMILRLLQKFSELRESMSPEEFADEWAKLDMIWKSSPFPTGRGNERHAKISNNLQENLKFSYEVLGRRTDLLWKMFSIIDMNSFCFDLPFRRFRALCVVLGLAGHSCVPNCHAYMHEPGMNDMDVNQMEQDPNDLTVVLESGRNLAAGTNLTFSYVPLTFGTAERRLLLRTTHMVWCMCSRCVDPTEHGTFTTNIKCPTCQSSMLLPTKATITAQKPGTPGSSTAKLEWECRGNTVAKRPIASTSAFRRVSRTCPPMLHEEAIGKLKGVDSAIVKYTLDSIVAVKELFVSTNNDQAHFYQSALLKLSEDIIRGTFFPLPDVLADDLTEFSDEALTSIVLAKGTYADFMQKINPGFEFEGFPIANLELAENELLGRETGRLLFFETVSTSGSTSHSRMRAYTRPVVASLIQVI